MAKKKSTKSKVSKTDAIRTALKETKGGSPSEVSQKLKKMGIAVTPQYVSTIKANDKRRAQSGVPRRKPGRPAGSGGAKAATATPPLEDLKEASELMLKAVELVLRAGAKEAKQLVNMAEGMVDRISTDGK
jgi:hypothetical protein